jgi:hypothetical protein
MDSAEPRARKPTASYAEALRGNQVFALKSKPKTVQDKKAELAPVPNAVPDSAAKKSKDKSPKSSKPRGREGAERPVKPSFSYAAALKGKAAMSLGPKDLGMGWETKTESVPQAEIESSDPKVLQAVVDSTGGKKRGQHFQKGDDAVTVCHLGEAELSPAVTDIERTRVRPNRKTKRHAKVDGGDTVHPLEGLQPNHVAPDSERTSLGPNGKPKDYHRPRNASNTRPAERIGHKNSTWRRTPGDEDAKLGDSAGLSLEYKKRPRRFSASDLSCSALLTSSSHPTVVPSEHHIQTTIQQALEKEAARRKIFNARMDRISEVIAAHDRGTIMYVICPSAHTKCCH